jgi:GTP-binding protein Era
MTDLKPPPPANQTSPENGSYRAGFVAIVGVPNAGKSSLMNRYLGQKVAIVTPKPQTTRHRLLGVVTETEAQLIFWDTPGLHDSNKTLNREMVSKALAALADSDVCLWLVDGSRRGLEHQKALEIVQSRGAKPLLVAINKVDLIDPAELPRLIAEIKEASGSEVVLAVSAKTGRGLKKLKKNLISLLPLSDPLYDEDTLTDQTLRSIAAEYVREAIFENVHQEIPYSTAVTIDEFIEPKANDPIYRLAATIHVERESQKIVMIGTGGRMLKKIGTTARIRLEGFLEAKVFLSLFVRITGDWSEDLRALAEFGYLDPAKKS